MKRLNEEAIFCFGCVTQINKEDGWEMKSRDSLARYEKITGEQFLPYEDLSVLNDPKKEDDESSLKSLFKSLSSFLDEEMARLLIKELEGLIEGNWQKTSRGRKEKLHPYLTPLIKALESLAKSKNTKDY
jgi:hypothetical protein